MLFRISLLLACFCLGLPAQADASPLLQQSDLEQDIAAFKAITKGKERESEGIALLDRFQQAYKGNAARLAEIEEALELKEGNARDLKSEKKDLDKVQKSLADTVGLAFSRKRVTEPHMRLWTAATYAWGGMGPHGSRALWKIFKDKRFSKDVEFRALIVRQVGETRDYTQAEEILDMFDHHEEVVAAAAGEAAALFERAPGKVRHELVARLVVMLESRHNAATDYTDTVARRIYTTVRGPFIKALSSLTGQSFRDPLEWTKWWNDNKKNGEVWGD